MAAFTVKNKERYFKLTLPLFRPMFPNQVSIEHIRVSTEIVELINAECEIQGPQRN
jgi:hypothetical protein